MTVYVDALYTMAGSDPHTHRVGARNGHRWCHLLADDEDELHAFAARLGMKREWFDPRGGVGFHYNVTPPKRALAVRLGARIINKRDVVELLRRHRDALAGHRVLRLFECPRCRSEDLCLPDCPIAPWNLEGRRRRVVK